MTSPWVKGTRAPVHDELDVGDLTVDGAIPSTLNGRLVRMTPNPVGAVGDDHVWFTGEGMVHAIDLDNGRAARFVNRWVRTAPVAAQLGETADLPEVTDGVDVANTSAFHLAGKLLALTETCPPYLLDDDLHTVGREDFGGGVDHFTAHPHTDPDTGQILGIGYQTDLDPTCTLYTIDADGQLASRRDIELLGPRSIHDVAFTPDHVILWDLPVEVAPDAAEPRFPFAWNHHGAARVGLIDRHDHQAPVRWFETDPCWVFHPLNAHQTESGVSLHVCQFDRILDRDRTGPGDPHPPQLWRWTINTDDGRVCRELVDDRIQEFPRIDDRYWGKAARYGYTTELLSRAGTAAIVAHDLHTGTSTSWATEAGRSLSEAVFVPDEAGAAEGDGWLLAIDSTSDHSELTILDATALSDGPVARIHLPQRIPDGFHGDWIPAGS